MRPRIENLVEKKLVGKTLRMSFSQNQTRELWQSFMPWRKQITNSIGLELYSIEVYDPGFFDSFDAKREFEKWAAIEVSSFTAVPEGMRTITLPSGLYAVFLHKGPASEGPKTYGYIFNQWLPASQFLLDHRPHFAVMGEKYKNDDLRSEEEIWIPIRLKANN